MTLTAQRKPTPDVVANALDRRTLLIKPGSDGLQMTYASAWIKTIPTMVVTSIVIFPAFHSIKFIILLFFSPKCL